MKCGTGCLLFLNFLLATGAQNARAIGWGPTDFLIGGGPDFTNKIGVFDSNLNFKGLLDPNFLGVQGMDFDAQGHLVAVSLIRNEVRVYDSSGAGVGGFTRSDGALGGGFDLKVAPDGSYLTAYAQNFTTDGAAQFSPLGDLLQRYGHDNVRGVAVVPGNRVWLGGPSPVVQVLDITSGAAAGSVSLIGMKGALSMSYTRATGCVLLVDTGDDAIFESTVEGGYVRRFDAPGFPVTSTLAMSTFGPGGDVFVTAGEGILHWRVDGTYVGAVSTSNSIGGVVGILWAGNVPEPSFAILTIPAAAVTLEQQKRDSSEFT